MSIRGKLTAGFVLVLVILGSVMGYLFYNLNAVDRHYSNLIDNNVWLKERGLALSNNFIASANNLRGYLLTSDSSYKNLYNQNISEVNMLMSEINSKLETLEQKVLFESISGKLAGYEKYAKDLIELKDVGKGDEAVRYSMENNQLLLGVSVAIEEFVKHEEKDVSRHSAETSQKVDAVSTTSLVAALFALLAGFCVALLISRSISRPVAMISQKAAIMAGGDLAVEDIGIKGRHELARLAQSFNEMKNSLAGFAAGVNQIAGRLADQSAGLAAQAQQTAAGAGETAATTGQIASTVDQVAQNAANGARAAQDMASHAGAGQQGLAQIGGEMAAIAQSTKDVQKSINDLAGDIKSVNQFVDMITGIAEQTNLLALNAAIEAARAGENGRGFSVVADEVRKLAEESGRSAREIRQVITRVLQRSDQAVAVIAEGAGRVAQGSRVVDEVSKSFTGIIDLTRSLTGRVQDVAAAAQQVSSGVQDVAATAQEQTASMEEVTAAAEQLAGLAEELREWAGKYKVA